MTTPALPEAFTRRIREQLGAEAALFLAAMEEPPLRGIRFHPGRALPPEMRPETDGPVPWEPNGAYLPEESDAGSRIAHAAGAYYIQEPGAMIPANVLDARPVERVLDLCSAPGGKATRIGQALQGDGLLVCNEPVFKRARILSENIEKTGIPNAVVTCAWPDRLAEKWPEGFDAVMVDAPCSGEGMFRRDPETRTEWSAEKAEGCAKRQRDILGAVALLVRPGGRLVYSTCTYNPAENEENAAWFLSRFPEFEPEAFSLPGIDGRNGMFTNFPHRNRGEGQFIAKFRKKGKAASRLPEDRSLPEPGREESVLFRNAFPFLPGPTRGFGNTLIHLDICPDLNGIQVIRAGLHLGEVKGKIAVPDHAAAMCFGPEDLPGTEVCAEDALRYLRGEEIRGDANGWTVVRYGGLPLGWGKAGNGVIKNHYPKGLRTNGLKP